MTNTNALRKRPATSQKERKTTHVSRGNTKLTSSRMTNEQLSGLLERLPYMTLPQANELTDFITRHSCSSVLELGFYHGVSTCYLANAVSKLAGGHVTSIDLTRVLTLAPPAEQLLDKIGLSKFVTLHYEPTSYTWRLMKFLEESPEPRFDFCFVDGPHNWFVDGFAFFLVDRLLKPGGWIVFSNLDWKYSTSVAMKNAPHVRRMPEEEKASPQIRKVFELLVCRQPGYGEFETKNGWGWARKHPANMKGPGASADKLEKAAEGGRTRAKKTPSP